MAINTNQIEEFLIDDILRTIEGAGKKLDKYHVLRLAIAVSFALEYKTLKELKRLDAQGVLRTRDDRSEKTTQYKDPVLETSGYQDTGFDTLFVLKAFLLYHKDETFLQAQDETAVLRQAARYYAHRGLKELKSSFSGRNNFYRFLYEKLFFNNSFEEKVESEEMDTQSDYYLKRFLSERGLDLEFLKQVDGPRTLKLLFRAKSFDDRTKAIKSVEQGLFGQMRVKKEEENDFSLLVAKESWTAFGMADFLRFNDPKKGFFFGLDEENKPVFVDILGLKDDSKAHTSIIGESGSGKSSFVKLLLANILKNHKDEVDLAFIDPKISTFGVCENIGNNFLGGIITKDFDQALEKIRTEMKRRNALSKEEKAGLKTMAVFIEEANVIFRDKASIEFLEELLGLAREVKIKLILIAQNISSENAMQNVRTNLTFKIGLKLATASFSKSAIGEVGCEKLQGKGDLYFSEDGKLRYAVSPLIEDEDLRKLL